MRRRDFHHTAAVWPLAARAQLSAMLVIGLLSGTILATLDLSSPKCRASRSSAWGKHPITGL